MDQIIITRVLNDRKLQNCVMNLSKLYFKLYIMTWVFIFVDSYMYYDYISMSYCAKANNFH